MSQSQRVAVVTGSTSGIGLSTARALAKRGMNIVINGFGDESLINSIRDDIETRYSVRCDYVAGDLSKLSEIDLLWTEVSRLYPNGIDILINNAGLSFSSPVEDFPTEKWDLMIAVMLTAPFHLIKRCLPLMKTKGWGRIVNVASAAGLVGLPNSAAYVSAKHGLVGLTKAVALESAAHGITCNAVCPAHTYTALMDTALRFDAEMKGQSFDDFKNEVTLSIPTRKFNTPEQVAELIEFLCLSNASSQITGASYLIDQGNTAQ